MRRRAEPDRREQGGPGGALAGRDDAAVLHEEHGRQLEGRRPRRAVALQPRHDQPLATPLGGPCPACAQQAAGSSFITQLNSGDETPGTADYTNIVTRYDEVVTPYTSDFLASDGNAVTNVLLQDKCPNDTSEHLRTPYDPPAIQITLNALGRSGPADPAYQPACTTT